MPSHDEIRALILESECRARDSFEQDARRELEAVDDASAFLANVMGRVSGTFEVEIDKAGVPCGGDVTRLKVMALRYIGVRGIRVVRAARSALAAGYEPETRSHDRILVELIEHRRAILADATGKAAFDWLKGKLGEGISGRVAAMQPPDLYRLLSQDSHGDPHPVARLIDASNTIELGPHRTLATRASLLMHAGFCRDQGVVIAKEAGITVNGLVELDAAIDGLWAALEAERPSASGPQ